MLLTKKYAIKTVKNILTRVLLLKFQNGRPRFATTHTLELLPEIDELLKSSNLKHRKHPGVIKMPPIKLPSTLINAVEKLLASENETLLRKDASEVCKFLHHRRMPVEANEIYSKVKAVDPTYDLNDIPEILKKKELIELKKKLFSEVGRWKPFDYTHHNCLAYLVARLSPNYASVYKILSDIKKSDSSFVPKTFFDFGSGVGSAVWAANTLWKNDIEEYFCVDASQEMNDISHNLLTDDITGEPYIKNVFFRQFLPASEKITYDLVVCAFSQIELPSIMDRIRVIDTLWRKTKGMLVIIEEGNNVGFQAVLDARDYILQVENNINADEMPKGFTCYGNGAHVVSPCPHDSSCPRLKESSRKPCGFYIAYESIFPSHSHQIKKDWISYAVLKKGKRDGTPWPRIVKPILKKDKHVYCRLCCADGNLKEIIVSRGKHGRHAYRCARSSSLGDLLPVTISPITSKKVSDPPYNDDITQSDDEKST